MRSDSTKYRAAERRLWDSFGMAPTEQRVHLATLDVDVRVQEFGEGPPVLLIHGASVGGTSWVNLVQGLSGFRCLMLDRPGCGLSDPLPGDAGRADIDAVKRAADQLVPDVLDGLGLTSAHVVGTSFGGFFAIRAAAAAPERIDRIVLYSWPMGVPMERVPFVMRFAGIPDELLARVASPVHCFWGEDDPNGGADTATAFAARLPKCTLELVPNAGHAPWIDETGRAIASTRSFLSE